MKRIDFPEATRSAAMAALPGTARPARQVRPTMRPSRLRMHEMRCSVLSMPALLSSPKSPSCATVQEFVYHWAKHTLLAKSIFGTLMQEATSNTLHNPHEN